MATPAEKTLPDSDVFTIGERQFSSRLLVGTGKYKDFEETRAAIEMSEAEIVTVAIRRTNIGQDTGAASLLDFISPDRYTILPNTAGCYTAEDAIRTPLPLHTRSCKRTQDRLLRHR